jgi:hypothetical protein
MKRFYPTWLVFYVIVASLPFGCSKGGSTLDPKSEAAHIGKAGRHVVNYISENKGPAPKSTAEIKDWATKKNIPEDELISTRDKEPYEIHEVTLGALKDLVLLETTGVKGKKYMWQSTNKIPIGSEASQEQIDDALKSSPAGRRRG